ncbi:undecaprenyl-diphosphatase [Sphingopyxis panaciterrae]|uniref:phosphatase PAP2 family protein n=1 Tax=Sphingopyxis panaciterrae TaxID=363841 RepID=UPI00141EC0ED|nr:phosphatase PAP2 family protein [Sphingopyxis panaciterrae]NIJ36712.1 undecaprenyl-diphosphatase [Sphingopyxis panaciterrae]
MTSSSNSPASATFARRAVLPVVLLFLAISAIVAGGFADDLDRRIGVSLALSADTSPPWLIAVMQAVSWVGGGTPRWVIVILLCALVWRWCGPRCAAALAAASLLSNLASSLMKIGFGRARPDIIDHLDHVSSASYPSGHATNAAVVYLLLAWLTPPRWRPFVWVLAAIMIVVNAFSRMTLGVHWASDIVGGTLLGAAFAMLAIIWLQRPGRGPFSANSATSAP